MVMGTSVELGKVLRGLGGWRKLHNQKDYNFTVRPVLLGCVIKEKHVTCMGDMSYAFRFLDEKPERKRPFERSRYICRWHENIKVVLGIIIGMD
jgi:hypothetical protein